MKLIGKAVDLRLEGTTSREIWPARLVLLAEGKKNADPNKLTIYKQTRWPFESANPNGPRKGKQLAIRSQAELAKLVGKNKVNDVAKLLRVRSFDWKKTMLIVVTAGVRPTSGFRVTVNSIAKSPKGIEVQWSVLPPGAFAGQAFTHPGQVALVERADGKITFKQNRNIKVLPPSANR